MIITTYKHNVNESINDFLPIIDVIEKRFGVVIYDIACGLFGNNKYYNDKKILRIWRFKAAKLSDDGIHTLSRDSIRVYVTE